MVILFIFAGCSLPGRVESNGKVVNTPIGSVNSDSSELHKDSPPGTVGDVFGATLRWCEVEKGLTVVEELQSLDWADTTAAASTSAT